MKFVDEVKIKVEAGNGGDGCLSFRREKYVERGGPNGGDGGDGGSIYLQGDAGINTLVDFRFQRMHRAQKGRPGEGSNCTGASGDDLIIKVPLGTMIYDAGTEEFMGDIVDSEQKVIVAQGGFHGLGNTRFKSSVNRAPRQTSKGSLGEKRELKLELKLLADVGLLGLPNAGKSSFIRAVSSAKPKVADYPFTTLHPNLGVVRVANYKSFVIADIPGLIEGAAEGIGLGIQFLKHLARTKMLLHLVDICADDPYAAIKAIEKELEKYSDELAEKPRWLVINKIDLLDETELKEKVAALLKQLNWQDQVYQISALTKQGTMELCYNIMDAFEA